MASNNDEIREALEAIAALIVTLAGLINDPVDPVVPDPVVPDPVDPVVPDPVVPDPVVPDPVVPDPVDPVTKRGFALLSPIPGYVATSPDVRFAWEDPSNLEAVYDLHIYDDPTRTTEIRGTDGTVYDTPAIGSATSHTFTADPSDGGKRYGRLLQWSDKNYAKESKQEILFMYTAFNAPVAGRGFVLTVPSAELDIPTVQFGERSEPNPDAVYELKMYSDAARNNLLDNTSGEAFKIVPIEGATEFHIDASQAGSRYGRLLQWSDDTRDADTLKEMWLEYDADDRHIKIGAPGDTTQVEEDPLDSPALPGYTPFLDVSSTLDYGAITQSIYGDIVTPPGKVAITILGRISTTTQAGHRCLGVKLEPTPKGPNGSERFASVHRIRDSQEVWLSQWILHPADTEWGGSGRDLQMTCTGVGIFGGNAVMGYAPGKSQLNGCAVRIVARGLGYSESRAQWGLHIYTAGQDAGTFGAELHNLSQGRPLIIAPRWTHHLTCVKVNSKPLESDGILAHWVDGEQVVMLRNLQWLITGNLMWDKLVVGNVYGGDQRFAPGKTQVRYLRGWKYKSIAV